jgi:hypothetical protein
MSSDSAKSDFILNQLKELLSDDTYGYATAVVTYCETKSLSYNYIGMAEFRDALTHVQRALYEEDESKIYNEINSAAEHIRRAAVESMQEYIELKYADIRKRILISDFTLFVARYKKPSKVVLADSENLIKNNIILGREAKPRKEWQEAIGYFRKAEAELEKLDSLLPTVKEVQDQYSKNSLIIIIIVILFLLGVTIIR